jgi:hypothetical protein
MFGAGAIPVPRTREKSVVAAGRRVRMIVAVSSGRVIGFLIVAVLVAVLVAFFVPMLVLMLIGTHRLVIVRTILGSGQRRG